MKHEASTSHDEAMVRELRENPDFTVEYLRAALGGRGRAAGAPGSLAPGS